MLYNYNKQKMKKINLFLFVLPAMLLTVACDNHGLKKTKSGLLYKIISDGKNPVVQKGQFLKLTFTQKLRDSVLYSSAQSTPAYVRVDSVGDIYSPVEVFRLLRKGDSAVIVQLADSIQRKSGQQLPPFLKKKDKIILTLRVLEVFATQAEVEKERAQAMESIHKQETKDVEDYLAKNNIQFQKTGKGVYVQIDSIGTGPAVDSGKQVSVRYTGKLFPSGKVFESNMEGPRKDPIKFVVGRKQIIQGWDEGLRVFKKGGKGTLYIPAFLAYDDQLGPGKKPNENLIFDVEIVDVTDAPAETVHPMMPMQQNMHRQMPPAPAHK
jgi:FKBP-type peptidyl-prolyl cis-trans isomerase FkpA